MSSLRDKRSSRTEATESGPAEVVVGTLVAVGEDGAPVVEFPGNPAGAAVRAMATARYTDAAPGSAVALMFVEGDRARPLAIGVIAEPTDGVSAATPEERLTFTAAREIVLQCGRASIVLTRAGKVLVRGAYVATVVGDAADHRRLGADQLTAVAAQ